MSPLRWFLTVGLLFIGSWVIFIGALLVLALIGSLLWEIGC